MISFDGLWSWFDWMILAAYFVGVLLVGLSMKKRAGKNVKSFFVASRRLTIPILIGVSAAGWYDSWTIVGLAECGWTMGLVVILIFVVPEAVLRIPLATIIGPHVRDQIPDWVVTVPDLLAYLYSNKVKLISAVTYIANMLYDSALLFAIGEVLRMITGMPMILSLVISCAVIVAYTAMSGLWGLAVTDLIQFAIMTISAGALMIGITVMYGGLPVVWEAVEAIDPQLLQPLGYLQDMGIGGLWEALAWIISACAMYCEAACYQRFGAAKNGTEIKTAYSIMLVMGLSFSMVMVLAGMSALAFFGDIAATPAEGFWALVFSVLPVGFRGLFVAALCAAVMSTVSSDFLLFSTCAVNDIYRTFLRPSMSEAQTVMGIRFAIVVFGVLTTIGTLLWADGIANAWYYLGGFLFAMFFIPITAGLFYKKKTASGALYCIVYSACMYVLWEFVLGCPMGVPSSLWITVTGAIVYFLVCNITYKKEGNKGNVTEDIYAKYKELQVQKEAR